MNTEAFHSSTVQRTYSGCVHLFIGILIYAACPAQTPFMHVDIHTLTQHSLFHPCSHAYEHSPSISYTYAPPLTQTSIVYPSAISYAIITVLIPISGTSTLISLISPSPHGGRTSRGYNILRISVRTLVIRFMSLVLTLGSPALAPNEASGTLFDQPTARGVS